MTGLLLQHDIEFVERPGILRKITRRVPQRRFRIVAPPSGAIGERKVDPGRCRGRIRGDRTFKDGDCSIQITDGSAGIAKIVETIDIVRHARDDECIGFHRLLKSRQGLCQETAISRDPQGGVSRGTRHRCDIECIGMVTAIDFDRDAIAGYGHIVGPQLRGFRQMDRCRLQRATASADHA
nr:MULTISPECIES: hypothetical protein [unclassified Sphingomonas]